VVLQELTLVICALGSFGGLLGLRMDAVEGEVPDNELDLALVGLQDLILRFITETLAEWSLVVCELDDGH
jgi:hypothetical protein